MTTNSTIKPLLFYRVFKLNLEYDKLRGNFKSYRSKYIEYKKIKDEALYFSFTRDAKSNHRFKVLDVKIINSNDGVLINSSIDFLYLGFTFLMIMGLVTFPVTQIDLLSISTIINIYIGAFFFWYIFLHLAFWMQIDPLKKEILNIYNFKK